MPQPRRGEDAEVEQAIGGTDVGADPHAAHDDIATIRHQRHPAALMDQPAVDADREVDHRLVEQAARAEDDVSGQPELALEVAAGRRHQLRIIPGAADM